VETIGTITPLIVWAVIIGGVIWFVKKAIKKR